MNDLVAKRYVKALKKSFKTSELIKLDTVFSALSDTIRQPLISGFIQNPEVSRQNKTDILLEAVKPVKSVKLDNFIKLLAEHGRLSLIGSISKELKKEISIINNSYTGHIYSNETIDDKTMENLSKGLSSKLGAKIDLKYIKNDFNGIKVDVIDLGVEIDFSKTKIDTQIINHILKAI